MRSEDILMFPDPTGGAGLCFLFEILVQNFEDFPFCVCRCVQMNQLE